MYIVQSVLLKKSKFTRAQAFDWIKGHGYKADKVDITQDYYRFRQYEPVHAVGLRYRTISLGDVGELVVMYAGPKKD